MASALSSDLPINDIGEVRQTEIPPIVMGVVTIWIRVGCAPRHRETESMKDGSDAVADWPLLNALLNTASGASWVSITTAEAWATATSSMLDKSPSPTVPTKWPNASRRVLTNDPGIGVVRDVDAGYDEAKHFAKEKGMKIPMARE